MWILLNVFCVLAETAIYVLWSISLLGLIILKLKTTETDYFPKRWSVGTWFRYMGNNAWIVSIWKGGEAICEVTFGGTEVFNVQKNTSLCSNITQPSLPSDKLLPKDCQGICVQCQFSYRAVLYFYQINKGKPSQPLPSISFPYAVYYRTAKKVAGILAPIALICN